MKRKQYTLTEAAQKWGANILNEVNRIGVFCGDDANWYYVNHKTGKKVLAKELNEWGMVLNALKTVNKAIKEYAV